VGTVKEFRDADHGQDLSEGIGALQDGQGIAGILGILNGYCGTYDDGPRKGWGPISVEVQKDGRVTRVFRTPNGHTVRAA
jgi:hypothetical protein